ncbi:PAS domain S-box-containing protein/diguanylate cyclase (GGDEF)-like protein [Undibacterium pigrum]|uniref:PAS domain S-box-containing protein/diguanylate cyclase (GGDEF)-like protein n=2 Tax=Undibacterium pigrum TaxID=401470 RepID=A0A318JS47_9BURK|nr:PAS domain S-box-containing protein/diguanylate cyclase (GGDEF)-like protein [Undibacterium pigrum]
MQAASLRGYWADMSSDTLHKSNDEARYLLSLYKLCMSAIADNTALEISLRQIINSLETHYPHLQVVVVANSLVTGADSLLSASDLLTPVLENTLHIPLVAEDFQVPEAEAAWQDALQNHGLSMMASIPLCNAGQPLLGALFLITPPESSSTPPSEQMRQELASLLADLLQHTLHQQQNRQAQALAEQSQASMLRMALAIEGSATGIWDRDIPAGRIHYSPGWKAILGYADSEITGRIEDSYARLHPDDLPYVQATIKAHFEGQTEQYVVEHRVRCKDGSYKWISSRGKVVSRAEDGSPLRMIGTTTDITAMRALSQRLQESADLVTCLTNEVPGLAYQYCMQANGDESFGYVSEGIRDIYELSPSQIHDSVALVHARIHPDDFPAYRNAVLKSASRLEHLHLEYRVNLPQQGIRWRQMDARPRRLPDGATLWHGFITDVTEHKRIEQELQELATIDFLTQIPNRRSFMGRIEEELARIQRGASKTAAVLMCDLDNFKLINDTYGHAVGDLVLRHFAHILHDELRKSDYAGRVGGEEFAVVLAGTSITDATVFAQRVQKQLLDTPVNAHTHIIPVTVSIGIAMMQASDLDADVSLSSSDMALYRAKESGRNCIVVAAD